MREFIILHRKEERFKGEYLIRPESIYSVTETEYGSIISLDAGGAIAVTEKPRTIYLMLKENDIEEEKGLYIKIYARNNPDEVAEKLYQMYEWGFLEVVGKYLVEYIEAKKEEEEDDT